MSTVVLENNSLTTDNILSGWLPAPLPQVQPGLFLYFDIPAFQLQLGIPVTVIDSHMESGKVVFKATIDKTLLILTVTGLLNTKEDSFNIEHVNIHIEPAEEIARADFITSTIRAALVLADDIHLRIPDILLNITLGFDEPLLDVSQMLRRRQIAYRIMVIERTVGHEFHLPVDISGDDEHDITLAYHAIVEGSFVWPINSVTLSLPATKEWANTLARLRSETIIPIGPDPFNLKLFGHLIELGQRRTIIQDAVIENFETVQKEISKGDGQMVPVVIRSTTGQARYDFFGVPKPPAALWDSNIQKMVELESQLDAAIVDRYHALAASTLAGLTEEQKKEVTTFPDLDEAFIVDADGE